MKKIGLLGIVSLSLYMEVISYKIDRVSEQMKMQNDSPGYCLD